MLLFYFPHFYCGMYIIWDCFKLLTFYFQLILSSYPHHKVFCSFLKYTVKFKILDAVLNLSCLIWPADGSVTEPDMSACFCPDHKAPMVLFLDRVYGIEDQSFLLQMLEVGFLPDLKASASLDTVSPKEPSSNSQL